VRAAGPVVSTYLAEGSSRGDSLSLGSGNAHITADALSGSMTSGQMTYKGHARLWQGDSVLDADQIEIWRDEKRLQGIGHVVAVFPQVRGPLAAPGVAHTAVLPRGDSTLWKIHAPVIYYWNDEQKARLEGGVTAESEGGSLESRTLDVFLGAAGAHPGAGGQLKRALALGGVLVRQGDRTGTAEQAEYTAGDGKFVLSGGNPTITDASGDTTTGHSLTFYQASDTILIDSQSGSRTLTKHRVEK
jgi:lipopolysaccharide export system protein LptA